MAQAYIDNNIYCQPSIKNGIDLLYVNTPLVTIYTDKSESLNEDELFILGRNLLELVKKNPVTLEKLINTEAAFGMKTGRKANGGRDLEGNDYLLCPCCSQVVATDVWRANYCPDCGQKILYK